jgi:hypothetical protein
MAVEPAMPEDRRAGGSLDDAFKGATYGCIAVGIASGAMGAWPLFFAYLPLTVHLALSAALGTALTGAIERFVRRPLGPPSAIATAAALTFAIFALLPAYLYFHRSIWPAALLFG